jgi:hypothetical protein
MEEEDGRGGWKMEDGKASYFPFVICHLPFFIEERCNWSSNDK